MASPINYKQPMQLVFDPDKRVIVKFPNGLEGQATFSNDSQLLKDVMASVGIRVPVDIKGNYPELKNSKVTVQLGDPSFGRAFYEVYFKHNMDPTKFRWEKIT